MTNAATGVSGYRADVDGLRAVAVLAVLLFHAGLTGLPGGYVGVDVFFVISGFVITKSMTHELAQGSFTIARFYERRARRILPALVAMILATSIFVLIYAYPPQARDYFASVASVATFTSNLYFWSTSGYFGPEGLSRPLLHTWSLAIEEQYYIFIPILFAVVVRYAPRALTGILVALALASFALCALATPRAPTLSFFVLPTRAWELLIGAIVALAPVPTQRPRWIGECLGGLGFALIAYAVLRFSEETPFPGTAAAIPVLGAALLIHSGGVSKTVPARLLASAPFVAIGRISYSLYLAHWPIIVLMRGANMGELRPADTAIVIVASFACAIASYHLVETPLRYPRDGASRRRVFSVSGAALAACLAVAATGVASGGFAGRFPGYDLADRGTDGGESWKRGTCFLMPGQDAGQWDAKTCIFGKGQRTILLWGDSLAAQYVPGLASYDKQLQARYLVYTMAACPPILSRFRREAGACRTFNETVTALIAREKVDMVLMAARWENHPDIDRAEIDATATTIRAMGLGVELIGQTPTFALNPYEIDYRLDGGRSQSQHWRNQTPQAVNDRLKEHMDKGTFIDPIASLCPDNICPIKAMGKMLYIDTVHFSEFGSRLAVGSYFPYLHANPTP